MARYTTTVDNNNINLTIDKQEHTLSLSRTGGQGSKGDSVTGATTLNGDIIFTITRADGTTYETNAGTIGGAVQFNSLGDVSVTNLSEGDVAIYDAVDSQWKNHQLTTSKVLDVDNTNKEDGAVLVYDNTTQKYQATNRIEKQTTHIIGGSF